MKPAFALDFRNDAIALFHRSQGGWHPVGRVTFDEPDLPAALSYLRATALGLSPRGLSTKLILPDDQVLFTTVDAPGPDDATRMAQIRQALDGRTPYAVEDLVFDWQVQGTDVHVAVIARETLAEAEAFATEHRFNPVAFAAAPLNGFVAEPWFGPSALAATLLADGEAVEREADPMIVVERGAFDDEAIEAVVEDAGVEGAVVEDAAEPAPEPLAEAVAEPEVAPEPEPEIAAEPEVAPDDAVLEPEALLDAAFAQEVQPAEAPVPAVAEPTAAQMVPAAVEAAYVEPLPEPRNTPIFGLADDEPSPSQAFGTAQGADQPDDDLPPDGLPPDLIAALQDTNLHGIVLEEAPMAVDVEDDGAPQETEGLTEAPVTRAAITDLSLPDDVPPAPGFSPAMGFASRRASSDEGRKVAPPPLRPMVDRPTAAKPLAPAAPKAERPGLSRPTAAKPVAAKEGKGLRGLGALVSAPSLPGSRKKRAMISSQPPNVAVPVAAGQTAGQMAGQPLATPDKSLARGLGARPAPVRGKPRYLGLTLTLLLLLVLAAIAAWSTSLAFRSNDSADTQLATTEAVPAPDDEMLADGIDPEAEADGVVAPVADAVAEVAEPVAEPAPQALASGQDNAPAAAVNPGAASGDEIFLAAKDPAPITPQPLDLPEVSAQGDPLPNAQAPPPPFGTVYQFDANGLIVPTPEGIVTPEGVLLIAGKPPRVPQPRPEGLAAPAPDIAAQTAATNEAAFPSDPALAKYRPKARPDGLVPPAPNPDDAALPTISDSDSRLASLRPKARPQAVLAAGDAARAATGAAAASLAAQAEATAAAAAANAPVSKLAVAISRKPQARPRDLSRAVEAAVAAAVRTPEPEPEPAPPAKSVRPAPEPKAEPEPTVVSAPKASKDKKRDEEADDEPELASAPVGKSQGSVAKQATFKNALNLSKTALIGVYGTPSNRYAMIRTEGGRYKKVKVGDKVDGGKIQAITASEVRYQKGSKLLTLAMPRS